MNISRFINGLAPKIDPAAIEGQNTSFHFDISGDQGGQYTVRIIDGKLEWEKGLVGEVKCKVNASADNLSKLLSGNLNPMMALLMGKLKISNQAEMLKYAKIFGLM